MPCKIVWATGAIHDLDRCIGFLRGINPMAASKAARLIVDGATSLGEWPNRCPLMDEETQRREFFIQFGAGAYVLRYVVEEDRVMILRVWHAREFRPK